jgi:hypothetical protein
MAGWQSGDYSMGGGVVGTDGFSEICQMYCQVLMDEFLR